MQVIETIGALRAARRQQTGRVGLVTTMGALHTGHISLVEQARADSDQVVVTIFVNPTQFAAHEDLDRYPRDLPRDLGLLESAGADLVFTPTPDMMYPPGFQTWVEVREVAQGLEGSRRPGHFRGVATVVAKLFNLCQADAAYFGQKDAQQVAVIKRMARDLDFLTQVIVCPTVRETDGLALSSRNTYLTPTQRAAANVLFRALEAAGALYERGERDPASLRETMLEMLEAEPLAALDYVSAADARTLRELEVPTDDPILLSLAARLGTTRLIDNTLLPLSLNNRDDLTMILGG
jgi:pantoate--beta-alanine ligase